MDQQQQLIENTRMENTRIESTWIAGAGEGAEVPALVEAEPVEAVEERTAVEEIKDQANEREEQMPADNAKIETIP